MMLVIQGQLPHYRRAFFNELSKHDDVLVIHSGAPNRRGEDRFRECVLPASNVGPFNFQSGLFDVIEDENPDTIVAMFDIRWISTVRAMFRYDRKINWIWWGLDEGGSTLALMVKCLLARRDNPIVFYNSTVLSRFLELGLNKRKLFVANNTFHVENSVPCFNHLVKDKFINVGTLDVRKQNDVTIRAFKTILEQTKRDLTLVLIGDGQDRNRLERVIAEEGLNGRVILIGRIENPELLVSYYQEAIASVSFGQAGLAVLQSMAFGVPFVTKTTAISGGEKHNIIHEVNGIFCQDSQESLECEMRRLVESPDFARELGRSAYEYYQHHASVENMVEGFLYARRYAENVRG